MKQLKWKSIQGIDYVLSIADGQSAVTQLTPSAQPFVTQTDTSDDIFQPVRPQTGNIGILGEVADMEALLATTPVQRPVTLTAMNGDTDLGTVWQGYLQTSAWSQAWDKGPNEISLPVVDHLGIIGSFTPQLIGWVRFGQFLLHMSSAAGTAHYTHWVFSKLTEPLTTLRYRFSMDNYRHYNTDTETWETDDYLTILEDICRVFGWQCQEIGTALVFLTADDPSQGVIRMDAANLAALVGGNTPTYDDIPLSTVTDTIYGASHTISYMSGAKDVKVTGNVNPIDKTIWQFKLDELTQGSSESANDPRGGDIVNFYTRNFYGNDELSVTDPNTNIRFDGFEAGGEGYSEEFDPNLQSHGYWGTAGTVVADNGWSHSQRLYAVNAGDKVYLRNWAAESADVVVRIFSNGAMVQEITAGDMAAASQLSNTLVGTITASGSMGLNYHLAMKVTDVRVTIDHTGTISTKGASIVSDRLYAYEQGGRIGAPLKFDTGWTDHIIMSGDASLAETPLVTITPRVQYLSTGLTAGKVFLLSMNVRRAQKTQDEWDDYSGFLWLRFKIGSTVFGTELAWIKDGRLRTHAANYWVDGESGLAINCSTVSGQITIEIGVPAVTTDYWTAEGYNYYYSLENITLKYTYDWRNYLWEDESANVERRTIGNGFTKDVEVTLNLTTQRGKQFGNGIILQSDLNYSIAPTLYGDTTPEDALADRMAAYYADSKQQLAVQLKCSGSMLQPWTKHKPVAAASAYMCLAQTIDWRYDQITAYLFEV